MAPKADLEARKVNSVIKFVEDCDAEVEDTRANWQDSHDLFQYGSRFEDKEEWQSQFSLNIYQSAIRAAQGGLMGTLIQGNDWWYLKPKSPNNNRANVLRSAFEKAINYYLDAGHFKRHAATFFLNSLISMGSIYVGWKDKLIQNPEYVLESTRKQRAKDQARRAKIVANPGVTDELAEPDMVESLNSAIEEFKALAMGEESEERSIPEYIQYGCPDFQNAHFQFMWWDPNAQYMEDSHAKAFGCEETPTMLRHWARAGYFSRAAVERAIGAPSLGDLNYDLTRIRRGRSRRTIKKDRQLIELIYYYGPLILDGKIVEDRYFMVIANRSVILKEGPYPFWEPPSHKTPVINCAVKEVPYLATGAGIGDSAKDLQRTYDSNAQLLCDTFRNGIAGINIIDYQALVDKGALLEGIEPGKVIEVRGDPKKVFHREQLTANLENQVSPVQEVIRQGIEQQTGINDISMGQPNLRSRTTAAETNARVQGAQRTVNTIALDLEQNFLVPILQKVFARFLQFGLPEINSNYELQSLMTEEELRELSQLDDADRMMVLNHFYSFQIKGFTEQQNADEILMRLNELMQIAQSGPASQLVNLPEVLRAWSKLSRLDKEGSFVIENSPQAQIMAETTSLLSGHMVLPAETDDHNMHLQNHMALMQTPYATPEFQQHVTMHQQFLVQMQAVQQRSSNNQDDEPIQ